MIRFTPDPEQPMIRFTPDAEQPKIRFTPDEPVDQMTQIEREVGPGGVRWTPPKPGVVQKIGKSFMRGAEQQIVNEDLARAFLLGEGDIETARARRTAFRKKQSITSSNILGEMVYGTATIGGQMAQATFEAAPEIATGMVAGGIAGAVTTAPVSVGPQGLLTEPAGIVGGAIIGGALGFKAGLAKTTYLQGAGEMIGDMLDQGIDPKVIKYVTGISAVPYALLELAQISRLSPAIKGEIATALRKSIPKIVYGALKLHGKTVVIESLQEVGQKAVTETAGIVGKILSGHDVKFDKDLFLQEGKKLATEGWEAVKSMALLPVPTTGTNIAIGITQQANAVQNISENLKEIRPDYTPEERTQVAESILRDTVVSENMPPEEQQAKFQEQVETKLQTFDIIHATEKRETAPQEIELTTSKTTVDISRQIEWLDRHKIQQENGKYVFYHGTPKEGGATNELRGGSLLTEDTGDAQFYAARDRDLKPEDIRVIKVLVNPEEIDVGHFASLKESKIISTPQGETAAEKPVPVGKVFTLSDEEDQVRAVVEGRKTIAMVGGDVANQSLTNIELKNVSSKSSGYTFFYRPENETEALTRIREVDKIWGGISVYDKTIETKEKIIRLGELFDYSKSDINAFLKSAGYPDLAKPAPVAERAGELEIPEETQLAEAKLQVEAAEIVKPRLYIGNVTPGMKARMADKMDWSTKDIKGFTEEGWPTKRTKIDMTKGEAENYLNWLETDLLRRLDQNKIKTRNDMAWANADWGDIVALRKSLDLEKIERPFYVVPGTKYEVRVIDNVRERMYQAIHATDESKMTVGEVLGAVMKRGARFAKMAYAGGRRELRADIRAKAKAKARITAAVKIIRSDIPKSVDIVYQEAIEVIKSEIDPSFSTPQTIREQENRREFIKRHPDQAKDIPAKLLDALGKKSLDEYTVGELEQVASEIERLKDLGKLRRKLEVSKYEEKKASDLDWIKHGSVPMNDREMFKPIKVGEKLSLGTRQKNKIRRMLNVAAQKIRSVAMPEDVLMDVLDGNVGYTGPNYKLIKEPLDMDWGKYIGSKDKFSVPGIKQSIELGMADSNYERIGVYAALQQEGGRQKLLDTGYTNEQIDEVRLTPEEIQMYEWGLKTNESLRPEIERIMRDVYNEPLENIRAYVSFQTNYDAMSYFELKESFSDRRIEHPYVLKKNVEKGFTVERTGGKQKIKTNFMEVMLRHIDDATYFIEMSADIKRLSEMVASKEYREAVGKVGQEEVYGYLDLLARKGGVERNMVIPWMDVIRKHAGAVRIGLKLSSALVQPTALLDGAAFIGSYAFKGAKNIIDPRWREFIWNNLPEIRERQGGDIDLLNFGKTSIEKAERAGFWVLQKFDGLTAMSVASGAYEKYMDEHGLIMDFETKNQDAVNYAQLIVRRSQASPFFKDLPSAFTRGTLTGNKSIDRLLLHFQTFILGRWSWIQHDMWRAGVKEKDVGKLMNMFFWAAMTGFAEMGIRRLSKEMIAMFTGGDEEDWTAETFTVDLVKNYMQNIPFISQGMSFVNYGNVPVPTIALIAEIGQKIVTMRRTKDPDKKLLHALELLLLSAGTITGLPGAGQATEIVRSIRKRKITIPEPTTIKRGQLTARPVIKRNQ